MLGSQRILVSVVLMCALGPIALAGFGSAQMPQVAMPFIAQGDETAFCARAITGTVSLTPDGRIRIRPQPLRSLNAGPHTGAATEKILFMR